MVRRGLELDIGREAAQTEFGPCDEKGHRGREWMANAKVKGWRKAARGGKENETPKCPMFRTTWGNDTFKIPYGRCAASAPAHLSEWEPDLVSREPTPSKEPEFMEREPLQGLCLRNLHAWNEVCPHATQLLSWVSMTPWSCRIEAWVEVKGRT